MSIPAPAQPHISKSAPSADELLKRARDLIPMLRERAGEVERAGVVPDDIVQAFKDAGFFRMLQPARWGGYEMEPLSHLRILMELGRGCASSAWVMMILGTHPWEIGVLDDRAGDEVWGQDDTILIASSYAPAGSMKRVDGGYLVNGKWPTSSGCDHARWAFLGAHVRDDEGRIVDRMSLLVSADDYQIIDDWRVFGLCGTGSKSLLVKDAFVPDYRAHRLFREDKIGKSGVYLLPFMVMFYAAVSAVIIGYGQGAIDIFTEQMKTRLRSDNGQLAGLGHYPKDRLARAVAGVRSARLRLEGNVLNAWRFALRNEPVPPEDIAYFLNDCSRSSDDVVQAVLTLYKALGARGIFLSNPMQRVLRDVLAAGNNITQQSDDYAEALGALHLGAAES